MKRILLSTLVLLTAIFSWAQDKPTITLTAEVDGNERSFTFGNATKAGKLQIDWGDGKLVTTDEIPVDDGWTTETITGTPVGKGEIKIYDGEDLCTFEAVSRVDGAQITTLDVTNATNLTSLTANANKIAAIDLSKNTKLQKLYLNNNKLESIDLSANTALSTLNLQENSLSAIDLTNNKEITTLYLSNNKFKTADLSANTKLKSLYFLNNELEDINLGDNTTLSYISLNNNKFTKLDLSKQTGLGAKASVFVTDNNLTELILPDQDIRTVNIARNKFDLSTLPKYFNKVKNLTYAPQQDYLIPAETTGELDLSSQAKVGDNVTTFTVKNKDAALTEGTDYTIDNGVITFLTDQDSVYVVMANDAYPKFTGSSVFKTTATTVKATNGISSVQTATDTQTRYFTLDGKLVKDTNARGIYVVKQNNKTYKIIKK